MSGLLTTLALCGLLQAQSMDRSVSVRGGLARVDDVPFAQIERDGQGARVLHMDVAFPAWGGDEPLPVILYIHGGGWFLGSRDEGHDAIGRFAEGGYFAATVDYRLGGEAAFPAAIHDVKAAVRFIKANAEELGVDPSRIGVVGYSAGGHLAALLGTSSGVPTLDGTLNDPAISTDVACVAIINGPVSPADLAPDGRRMYERWLGGAESRLADPATWLDAADAPMFLLCGGEDRIVPLAQAQRWAERLMDSGVEVELEVVSGQGHVILDRRAYLPMLDFLDAHLGGHVLPKPEVVQ